LRNDARDNMLGALLIAGQYVIPEVIILLIEVGFIASAVGYDLFQFKIVPGKSMCKE